MFQKLSFYVAFELFKYTMEIHDCNGSLVIHPKVIKRCKQVACNELLIRLRGHGQELITVEFMINIFCRTVLE
jgi:hypothetical protein